MPPQARASGPVWATGILAALAWAAFGALTWLWPNQAVGFSDWAYTTELGIAALAGAALLALVALAGQRVRAAQRALATLRAAGPWLVALPVALAAWEILTAKTAILPTPFFAPPQALIEVYADDWRRLGDSAASATGCIRCCACWARFRRPRCCR